MTDERDVELIDYLHVLWRWKWLIVVGTVACVLAAGLVTWRLPKTYSVRAAVDTGDLSEERVRDVERLVARLNAAGFREASESSVDGKLVVMAAEFKKPFVIELRAEGPSPGHTVTALEQAMTRVMQELDRLLKSQHEDNGAKVEAVRAQVDAAQREAETLFAQLRTDFARRAKAARAELESVGIESRLLPQETVLLQRRLGELRTGLNQLRAVRNEAARGAESAPGALVFSQLSRDIVLSETAVTRLEQELTVELPARMRPLRIREETLKDLVGALDAASRAVQGRTPLNSRQVLATVRETVDRVVVPGSEDAKFLESTLRKLDFEGPEKLRAYERQLGELTRRASSVRAARVLAVPELPQVPIRPRLKLNLLFGFGAGLVGSSLLAFAWEYVRKASARRSRGGRSDDERSRQTDPAA